GQGGGHAWRGDRDEAREMAWPFHTTAQVPLAALGIDRVVRRPRNGLGLDDLFSRLCHRQRHRRPHHGDDGARGLGLDVQYKTRAEEQPFEKYVADAAAAMRDEAYVLLKMAEMPPKPEPASEARTLGDQVERLRRCLKVFQKGSPYTQIRNY